MSCFKTSESLFKSKLRENGLVDNYLNILNLGAFRTYVTQWSAYAKQQYGITERVFFDENGKAIPNKRAFQIIDYKKGVKYPENEWIEKSLIESVQPTELETEEPLDTLDTFDNLEQQLYQIQSHSRKQLTPEVKEQLLSFLKNVNPDFRVEVIDDLSVNGLVQIPEFLIQLKRGKEDLALSEETSHVFVELLGDKKLKGELMKDVVRTKMYKWVLEEYREVYGNDYEKMKRETAAKLISLYIQDREAFNYWSGSEELNNNLSNLIRRLIDWIKRNFKNPYSKSALRILKGSTEGIDVALAKESETYYQLDSRYKVFETLNESDITKYGKVYINLNNTILNYKNFQAQPMLNKTAKGVKAMFFSDVRLQGELDRYYSKAKLTKLGRELKDKLEIINPNRIVIFTDAPITDALVERLEEDFGPVSIIRTGYNIQQILFDEFGNPVDMLISGSEKEAFMMEQVRENPKDNLLFIDNQSTNLNENLPNLNIKLYSNDTAQYTDVDTRIRQETLAQKNKEFSQGVVEELSKVDKDNLVQLAIQSRNMVQNHIRKLERGEGFEELSAIFKDEYGNVNIPLNKNAYYIQRLLEDKDTFDQGLLNFVQTIESTRMFFNKANENDFKPLKDLIEQGSTESIDKAIREAAVLMRMILSWEQWVKEIRPYINDTKIVNRVINDLASELNRANVKLNEIAVDVLSKSLAEQWKPFNQGIEKAYSQGLITSKQREQRLYSAQKLVDWLKGTYGDMNTGSAYFENPLMQAEPVIQAISRRLEKSMIGSEYKNMEKNIPVMQDLWSLSNKIGQSEEQIGNKLTYVDLENYWENGEMKQRETLFLLNEWTGLWQRKARENQVQVLKDQWLESKNSGLESNEKELVYLKAKQEFDQWVKDNWYDEVTPEGKDVYRIFGLEDRVMELAKERQKEIYDALREQTNILKRVFITEPMEQSANKEVERLVRELRLLRNEYTPEGELKQGDDLLIARKLKDKSLIDRQIYDYELNSKDFLDAINEQIVSIADENTRNVLSSLLNLDNLSELYQTSKEIAPQSFIDWLDRNTRIRFSDSFYEERGELINQIKQLSQSANSDLVNNLWKELTNLTSFFRDKDNVFDASDSSPDIQQKVKEFELAIEDLKNTNTNSEIIPLIQRLSEIQGRKYTDYYRDMMYDWLKDIYPGISTNQNYSSLINSREFRDWIETDIAKDFKEWFIRNHYTKQVWDEYTQTKQPKIVPTYIWTKIEPTDSKDILVIPGWKYNKRILKDRATVEFGQQSVEIELKTPKIDWVTWNPLERKWLPKSDLFKSKEYKKLRDSNDPQDKLLFEYLQKVTNYSIDIQTGANYDSVIGFKVPRFHKKYTEGGILNRAWKAAADQINPREEGTGALDEKKRPSMWKKLLAFSGIESEEQTEQVKRTDYLGNESKTVYTPYTQYLDPKDMTKDLTLSLSNYAAGVEKVKALISDLPTVNLLQQVFEQFKPKKKGTVNQYGEMIDAGTDNRYKVLQHIIETKFYSNFKDFELGKGVDAFAVRLRKLAIVGSQSDLNIPNAVKNWLQGQSLNFLFVKDKGWGSRRSLWKAIRDPKVSYTNYVYQMGKENKSIDYHILTFFNPLLEKRTQGFTKGARGIELQDRALYYTQGASEFGVTASLLYAHLYNQDVTINGEKKKLYDAFTLTNGVLSIKPETYIGDQLLTNEYIQDLKLRFKMMMEDVGGKQWNQTLAQRFTVWQSIEFFKRFFITMFRKRFFFRRDNIELGETEGIYVTTFKWMVKMWHDFVNGTNFSQALTPDEKRRLNSARDEFLLAISTLFIISYLFGFDEDDEDKYTKLKDKSWLENMMLLIALNTKRETDSITPFPFTTIQNSIYPPIVNETYNFITQPFVGFTVINESRKMLDSLLMLAMGNDKAYYDRDMPAYLIEEGDTKFQHYLEKVTQIDNFLYQFSPEAKIQVIVQSQNR